LVNPRWETIRRLSVGQRLLIQVGSLGPLGFLPASGSATVLVVGVPLFYASRGITGGVYLSLVAMLAAAAVWLHQVGDRLLDETDSGLLVWDELVGFLLAVALVPFSWQTALVAVVIERTLDIVKAPPAGWVERTLPGGVGVVGDDLVAGAYTCGILHLLVVIAPGWFGVG
jgi:phosphatidylglycerophosphatase A